MKGREILFFATHKDLELIMEYVESKSDLTFVEMGLFDSNDFTKYNSVKDISRFCKPPSGDWNKDLRLIVIPRGSTLTIRNVPQRAGGVKYAIDPTENQTSICFQFGGIYQDGIIVAGKCSTIFLSDFALDIYKNFSSTIKKQSIKVDRFYVLKDAEDKLRNGWRLVINDKMPTSYDIAIKSVDFKK